MKSSDKCKKSFQLIVMLLIATISEMQPISLTEKLSACSDTCSANHETCLTTASSNEYKLAFKYKQEILLCQQADGICKKKCRKKLGIENATTEKPR